MTRARLTSGKRALWQRPFILSVSLSWDERLKSCINGLAVSLLPKYNESNSIRFQCFDIQYPSKC